MSRPPLCMTEITSARRRPAGESTKQPARHGVSGRLPLSPLTSSRLEARSKPKELDEQKENDPEESEFKEENDREDAVPLFSGVRGNGKRAVSGILPRNLVAIGDAAGLLLNLSAA